ncbi:MAG: HAMP domain-containing sensor histidine kinase [Chitinophagales bacterium]
MKRLLILTCILFPFIVFGNSYQRSIDSINHLIKTSTSETKKIELLTKSGQYYIESNNHTQALDCFLQMLNLCKHKQQDSLKIVCYNQISRIFFYQNNFAKSDYYNNLALKLSKKNPLLEGDYYKRKGDVFASQLVYDSAQFYYAITEKLYKKSKKTDSLRIAGLYANLSITYYQTDKVKAIEYAYKAKDFFGNNRDSKYYINQGNIGNFYKDIVRFNEYESLSNLSTYVSPSKESCIQKGYLFIQDAITLASASGNRIDEAYYTGILSELQEVDGDYRSALLNFKTFYEISDSVYSQDIKNELAEKESALEIEKKNQEIILKQIQLTSQKRLAIALIIGIVLLSIMGLLLYFQASNRKKNNILLNHLNTELSHSNEIKAKIFGILSHDLRSPIANLITLLQLKKNESFDNKKDEELYTEKVILSAEHLLENMETLLLWSKGQMQNFKPNYQNILISELFRYIAIFFEHEKQVLIQFNNPDHLQIISDEIFLQIIMQNLTSNAIKSLKNTDQALICWNANQTEDGIMIQITDNGPGMDENKLNEILVSNQTLSQKSGLGLQIVNDLAKAINCKLHFKTALNKGFSVTIIINK